MKIVYWIKAARLRTLPLAFSCILMGASIAKICSFEFSIIKLILALFTTLFFKFFQILQTIMEMELKVAISSGKQMIGWFKLEKFQKKEMKKGIILMSVLGFLSGILLIFFSFPLEDTYKILLFLVLGVLVHCCCY